MSLLKITTKKAVSKSAVIRGKIARRLKEAISLIVTRGAHVSKDKTGKERIEFDQGDIGGGRWILSSRSSCGFIMINIDLIFPYKTGRMWYNLAWKYT